MVLDTHNVATLGVADLSFYPQNLPIVNPTLRIIPPSFPPISIPFSVGSLNIYNSNTLNLTCSDNSCDLTDLPDGYWELQYTIAPPQTYQRIKNFFRTDIIQRELNKAFLDTDLTKCDRTVAEQLMKQIDQITYYIQTAIAAGNNCNPHLALKLYKAATYMLKEFIKGNSYGNMREMWN